MSSCRPPSSTRGASPAATSIGARLTVFPSGGSPPIGPIDRPLRQIEFKIDRFRKIIEDHCDVATALRRRIPIGNVDARAENAPLARVGTALLGPVHLPSVQIGRDEAWTGALPASFNVTKPIQ